MEDEKVEVVNEEKKEESKEMNLNSPSIKKLIFCLTYFLFFLPLIFYPEDKEGKFHANQSLVLLILNLIMWAVFNIISIFTPHFMLIVLNLIATLVTMFYWIFGIVSAATGSTRELPIIGKIKILK